MSLVIASMLTMAAAAVAGDDKTAAPPMDPAAMQAMEAAGKTGEQHAMMQKLAGDGTYTMKLWMAPGAPPMESSGKRTAKLILGDRFLEETYSGTFMGQPFEGIGTLGYDNVGKQYVTTWIDNMSTGIMMGQGQCDKGVWTMTSESLDPVTGKTVMSKSKVSTPDANTIVMEMFMPGEDGKDFKMMAITCKKTM
jgi:hypothetical protein